MLDIVAVVGVLAAFALALAYVEACDQLKGKRS